MHKIPNRASVATGHLLRALILLTLCLAADPWMSVAGAIEARETRVVVDSVEALFAAIEEANVRGNATVAVADGVYSLDRVLIIRGNGISLESLGRDPTRVILRGRGMRDGTGNLLVVSGRYVRLSGITLEQAGNHLVQLRGEADADEFTMINCVLRDSWEQLFKVSKRDGEGPAADFGVLRNNRFEYSGRFGPHYYIGGVDLHGGRGWVISGNTFRNIASPSRRVAEHAIHLWNGSADNTVENNLIVNSDRGIGFGLTSDPSRGNQGGEIAANTILHTRQDDPFSDVGIALESSPGTRVIGNVIYLGHSYPNAIEYRFQSTRDVEIAGNITNRAIVARDGAEAVVRDNRIMIGARRTADRIAARPRSPRRRPSASGTGHRWQRRRIQAT